MTDAREEMRQHQWAMKRIRDDVLALTLGRYAPDPQPFIPASFARTSTPEAGRLPFDGSLPRLPAPAGVVLRRSGRPPADRPQPERDDMTNDTATDKAATHTPTPAQLERQWALSEAKAALLTSKGGAIFTAHAQELTGDYSDLTLVAEWLIGVPVHEAGPDAFDLAHKLLADLTPGQSADIMRHAFQHAGISIALLTDTEALSSLSDEHLATVLAGATERIGSLPVSVQNFRASSDPVDFEAFLAEVREHLEDADHNVTEKDGALVVDEKTEPESEPQNADEALSMEKDAPNADRDDS